MDRIFFASPISFEFITCNLWVEQLDCHTGHKEVIRFHTRDESILIQNRQFAKSQFQKFSDYSLVMIETNCFLKSDRYRGKKDMIIIVKYSLDRVVMVLCSIYYLCKIHTFYIDTILFHQIKKLSLELKPPKRWECNKFHLKHYHSQSVKNCIARKSSMIILFLFSRDFFFWVSLKSNLSWTMYNKNKIIFLISVAYITVCSRHIIFTLHNKNTFQ